MNRRGIEKVWKALADPTRRGILDLLRDGPRTTGDLCGEFAPRLTRYAVMKHLGVLERAGLVLARREGRQRWNHLNAAPLRAVYERWVRSHQDRWAGAVLGLQRHAEGLAASGPEKGGTAMAKARTFDVAQNELEVAIDAPAAAAWKALMERTNDWWPADFYADSSKPDRRFVIEARLGGRMYEDWGGGGGLVWATVIGLEPGRWVEMLGSMTAKFGGPAMSMIRFEIEERGDRACALRVSDTYFGALGEGVRQSLDTGWRYLFEQTFKAHVEGA